MGCGLRSLRDACAQAVILGSGDKLPRRLAACLAVELEARNLLQLRHELLLGRRRRGAAIANLLAVCPYAKIVQLYPSSVCAISGLIIVL